MKRMINVIIVMIGILSIAVISMLTLYVDREIRELKNEKQDLITEMFKIDVEKALNEPIKEPTQYETASKVYGINPKLLEAIERLETGNFTSEVFKENNNAYGGRYKGEYLKYDNHYQSTMELARLLKFSYFNIGITDLHEIGKTYCPDDSLWADKVMEIYDGLLKEEKNEQIQRRN